VFIGVHPWLENLSLVMAPLRWVLCDKTRFSKTMELVTDLVRDTLIL